VGGPHPAPGRGRRSRPDLAGREVAAAAITRALFTAGLGGFFYDDQEAIRGGAERDGELYRGAPRIDGFDAVRIPARTIGVGFGLGAGRFAWGDAMSVQYAGAGGRDPALVPERYLPALRERFGPAMVGIDVREFRAADAHARRILSESAIAHAGIEYGVSQALLDAAAQVRGLTMAEVLCEEYGLELVPRRVPIYTQSGDHRRDNVDKMILKRADVLPHALINAPAKFGDDGRVLLEYVAWVRDRILGHAAVGYHPTLHLDLYGIPGRVLGAGTVTLASYLARLGDTARPFALRVESPVDYGSRDAQVAGLAALRAQLDERAAGVEVVADEWCDTLEDVRDFARRRAGHMLQIKVPDLGSLDNTMGALRACREHGTPGFLGGSCTETDVSARVCVHVAVATQPPFQLAKPGMGVDEGLMIVRNEQERLLARLSR
jgi:methylaspartate ammonia-lyase